MPDRLSNLHEDAPECVHGACKAVGAWAVGAWCACTWHGMACVGLLAAHRPIVGAEVRAGTDRAESVEGAENDR